MSKAQPFLLRAHRPEDMDWIVRNHGEIYSREYGWSEQLENLVAKVAAEFLDHHDPGREACWVAEAEGKRLGSIFLTQFPGAEPHVAKLRLLLVLPEARGLGIGKRLVDECLVFARRAGYRKVALFTESSLVAARKIYDRAGFRLISQEPDLRFGPNLTGEIWELDFEDVTLQEKNIAEPTSE